MSSRSPKARTTSSLRRLAAAALVVACAALIGTTTAAASNPVPYTDFQAKGSVGLCDKSGNAVTSGRITDRPFVWFAVSSMAAPQGYAVPGRKATLFIYQPRPNTYPNQWSADQMTSSSPYTNPRYPMAAATDADFSLKDYIAEFPPRWNGLLQLRIYYGAPGKPTWTDTYAATDITVSGSTWRVVRGASVPCTKGTAKPNETFRITPSPTGAAASPSTTSSVPTLTSASPSPSDTATPSASGEDATSASPSAAVAAASESGTGSGAGPAAWLLGLVTVAAVAGGGAWWYRRRTAVAGPR